MDGCLGRNLEDLDVTKYEFPSQDTWGGWTITHPEATEKCFLMDHYDAMNHGFSGGLYGQIQTGSIQESDKLNVCGELRSDHHQLHDFNGIEQMDDTFLSSILEDASGNWSHHSSSELSSKPSDNGSISSSHSVPCNSGPCVRMPSKRQTLLMNLDAFEENPSNECCGLEPCLEQVVLQDLQRATQKLTDETRKCFRDTFYRLAKNLSENEEALPMKASRPQDQGDRIRSRRDNGKESKKTNSIDRVIAGLAFNKMESNIGMFPLPERSSSIQASDASPYARTIND